MSRPRPSHQGAGGHGPGGGAGGRGPGSGPPGGGRRGGPPAWRDLALPIPHGARILPPGQRAQPDDNDNLGLWLDKLIARNPKADWSLGDKHRVLAFEPMCKRWNSRAGAEALVRQRATMNKLFADRLCVELSGQVNGRLLVDYGRASTNESSISFHPMWGVPRIPGSALKGVTRAYLEQQGATAEEILDVFGTTRQAGLVCFFDALPRDGSFELSMDVLTPHYGEYYRGQAPPADYLSPVPFTFLSIVNTEMVMHLGAVTRGNDRERGRERARDALQKAKEALAAALTQHGVGAKTAAGYGRLTNVVETQS
jgi:CRISPR-associated protein Cmr6